MQELLSGKRRLPGFSGEWEVKRLGDVASIRNTKVFPSTVDPFILCIELEHIMPNSGKLVTQGIAKESSSMKYEFYTNDILFGRLRPYLRKFLLAFKKGICSTEIWPLVASSQVFYKYLYQIVQTDKFIESAGVSYGTHMPRADWIVMRNFEFYVPKDINEQQAIAAILSDMDAEIITLESRRNKTKLLKQGMMQELLTGRIRLPMEHSTVSVRTKPTVGMFQ